MATQAERRASTRQRILDAARALLVDDGVAATTTAAIIEAAGVSRGALYHHFASLDDVVAAVYEREAAGAIDRAVAAVDPATPADERLVAACLAWLDVVAEPAVARILVIDGPAALGTERARSIEEHYSLGLVEAAIAAALGEAAGRTDVAVRARLVNAALAEAALLAAADPTTRAAVRTHVRSVVGALAVA